MNVTITNHGTAPVPVVLGNAGAADPLAIIEAGHSHEIDDDVVTVLSAGDNPSFFDALQEDLSDLLERLKFWRDQHPQPKGETGLVVEIVNRGDNQLRVLGDSNVNEYFVPSTERLTITAERYVEIREQGVG